MKKTTFFALAAISFLFTLGSCTPNAPKASLKTSVDTISYAYGVNLADQGLLQYLEQMGVLENTSGVEYEYQAKISSADSIQKPILEKELKAKLDSINKINNPRLNDFIRGVLESFGSNAESKFPYAQGLLIGKQISKDMMPQFSSMVFADDSTKEINNDQVLAGFVGLLKKESLAMSGVEAGNIVREEMENAQKRQQEKQEAELKVQYQDSIAVAEKFLAENAKRPEVTTTESGLQYEVIRKGNGPLPTDNDRVKVHYHGTLINGTVFDSSVNRGQPSTFGVTQVIKGWTEALKLMPVGSKWKLYIPYDLAYGSQDRGTIKPFSTLIFEVELLGIEK